jgi:hypothetical protein
MTRIPRRVAAVAFACLLALVPAASADTVVPDTSIVQGNQCVGPDCVNGELFNLETLKLKANNTRIKFEDTSTTPGLPSTDWELTANDSNSGGQNLFRLTDLTANRSPFTVEGSAPTDSLFVGSNGKLGIQTNTPQLDLHMRTTNTPAIRFEQTNGGGFTAQTWDVGANEANFFVRDLTGGSRLPFRIRPGAPTSSVDIAASGNVGVGTQSPGAPLHVRRTDGSAQALVEEVSGTTAPRLLADLSNNGPAEMRFRNTAAGATSWRAGNAGTSDFALKPDGSAAALTLTPGGDVTSEGALQQPADGAAVESPADVDPQSVLSKVVALPLRTYEFSSDPANARHLGPAGSDFRTALGLGGSDSVISPADLGGVSLVAIKALNDRIDRLTLAKGDQGPQGQAGQQGQQGPAGTVDPNAAKQIKALISANKKQDKRLKALEKKLKSMARARR